MDFSIFFKNLVTFVLVVIGVEIIIVLALRLRKQKRTAKPQLPPSHQPRNTTLPEEIEARVREKLEQGRTIEAVKIVRTLTGWGLKEAKEYVDKLENNPGGMMPIAAQSRSDGKTASIEGLPQQVAEFLQAGDKIGAVKAVRAATGWGLKESKEYVDALQDPTAARSPAAQPPKYSQTNSGEELLEQVASLLLAGNKIGAIKAVRAATGWGLREAKEHVDRIEREQGY